MSHQDFGAIVKQDLRRVTGDQRLGRHSIRGVGTKAPAKVKPGLEWAQMEYHLGGKLRDLFVVYRPTPPRDKRAW